MISPPLGRTWAEQRMMAVHRYVSHENPRGGDLRHASAARAAERPAHRTVRDVDVAMQLLGSQATLAVRQASG
jgi:hypothetical protein